MILEKGLLVQTEVKFSKLYRKVSPSLPIPRRREILDLGYTKVEENPICALHIYPFNPYIWWCVSDEKLVDLVAASGGGSRGRSSVSTSEKTLRVETGKGTNRGARFPVCQGVTISRPLLSLRQTDIQPSRLFEMLRK